MKFRQESSTAWHSKLRRRRTAGLKTIFKKNCVLQGRALHIEQVWCRSREKTRNYMRAEKSADRRTDRQHFILIYVVDTDYGYYN